MIEVKNTDMNILVSFLIPMRNHMPAGAYGLKANSDWFIGQLGLVFSVHTGVLHNSEKTTFLIKFRFCLVSILVKVQKRFLHYGESLLEIENELTIASLALLCLLDPKFRTYALINICLLT